MRGRRRCIKHLPSAIRWSRIVDVLCMVVTIVGSVMTKGRTGGALVGRVCAWTSVKSLGETRVAWVWAFEVGWLLMGGYGQNGCSWRGSTIVVSACYINIVHRNGISFAHLLVLPPVFRCLADPSTTLSFLGDL